MSAATIPKAFVYNSEFMEYLQCKGYTATSMVYSTATCWVYRGKHPGCPNCTPEVAIKIQSFSSQQALDRASREIENQVQLHHHPNVVQLFEYFYEPTSDNRMLLFLVLEWVEKDLMKDIEQRRTNNFPWCEMELVSIAGDLIKVLAEAERLRICHRDIKPQNIFYSPVTKCVKLGDFGSSAAGIFTGVQDRTMVGTPLYMSEELKLGLLTGSMRISHDVVKSDVYALGVTLLVLAKLRAPVSLMTHNDELLISEITALPYSDWLKGMIWNMLNPDVAQRYTFEQLEREYTLVPMRRSQSADFELARHYSEDNPCETDCVQQVKQPDPVSYKPVCTEPDLKLRYSYSEEPPFSAQQPSGVHYQGYPCEQTANHVANPLFERNQIGMNYANPIPAAIVKSDADSFCIQCGTEMSTVSKTKSIMIKCPEGHTMNYCTRTCFIEHVESVTREYTGAFICFRCVIPINQETVIQFYGGMDAFTAERTKAAQREFMCVACKNILATHSLEDCGHIYCKKCAKTIRKLFPRTYTCTKCGKISHKKHNLRELPFWKKKPKNYKGTEEAKVAKLI